MQSTLRAPALPAVAPPAPSATRKLGLGSLIGLAVRFIRYDKAKSIGALLGVVISTFLVGQQVGIFIYLLNAMSAVVDNTPTDMWVVDSKTTNGNALTPIDLRIVQEVASLPGVKAAHPMVLGAGNAIFSNGQTSAVQLIGSEPSTFAAGPARLDVGSLADLVPEGAVAFDKFDKAAYGGAALGATFEINGKRAYLAAQTAGVRGFGARYMYTTLERARYLGGIPLSKVSAVLVDLKPDADKAQVMAQVNQKLFGVRAWLPEEFSAATKQTVLATTGIAISIGTLVIFAFISGFFIIGLTLYSAATDRLKDYGTLKAIGATDGFITRLILLQAYLFALVGFVLGYSLVELFRNGVATTGTIFKFGFVAQTIFFCFDLVICLGGAAFAVRRIRGIEPAMVFRG